MDRKTCCFVSLPNDGSLPRRLTPSEKEKAVGEFTREVERMYLEEGFTRFISDAERGLGLCFAFAVLAARENGREVTLELALSSEEQTSDWGERDRDEFFLAAECCDTETMVGRRAESGSVVRRNRYMIGQSDEILPSAAKTDGDGGYSLSNGRKAAV